MSSRERPRRAPMERVAVIAPRPALRSVLVEVADEGVVEFDPPLPDHAIDGPATLAARRGAGNASQPVIARDAPDVDGLVAAGAWALLAGEADLEQHMASALDHGRVAGLLGWVAADAVDRVGARVEASDGAIVVLPRPAGVDPPTLLARRGPAAQFRVLVDTYGTVRYADVDPTPFAAIAFVVMFGMMFGDAGHGAVLVALGLLARSGRGVMGRVRAAWALLVAAGIAAIGFGFAYGEVFGPTHALRALWLVPLDQPVRLLVAGVVVGAVLLGVSEVLGTVNRWRESGPAAALYDPTGVPALCSYAGLVMLVAGVAAGLAVVAVAGGVLVATGMSLVGIGRVARGGRGSGAQAVVESLDGFLRLGSNVVSFARLAAFGLMHAAIGSVVWDGTVALWHPFTAIAAVVLFIAGNAIAFALEALVVSVQALRLEYYELFSRIFGEEGRPFRPWHVPLAAGDVEPTKEAAWQSG